MSSFTSPLRLEWIDGSHWRVLDDFTYEIGDTGSGKLIVVPAGFITDFASVPRGLWNLFPPTGPYGKAALVHDVMYTTQTGSRKEADDIFLEAMGVLQVRSFTKYAVYSSVRMWGWKAWATHRQAIYIERQKLKAKGGSVPADLPPPG